jgi:hypothetical protein
VNAAQTHSVAVVVFVMSGRRQTSSKDRAADFLARAVEAEHQASRGTGAFRTQLLGLAELWRGMACKAEVLSELEQMLARGDLDPTER